MLLESYTGTLYVHVYIIQVPTVEEIYKTSERLQDFLKLKDLSVQVPTPVLISKFIVLLNLPGKLSVHTIINQEKTID